MTRRAGLLALLVLTGCAHQGVPPAPTDAARLLAVEAFELRGRIGVRTTADGFNGSLRWSQRGDELHLLIFGPLGVGRTELRGTLAGVEIIDAKGQRVFYDDPEAAFSRHFGWSLPLRALRYWVLGVPAPGEPVAGAVWEADAASGARRLRGWRQSGWQVAVTQYAAWDDWVVPRKLSLAAGETTIKLVAGDWTIPPAAD